MKNGETKYKVIGESDENIFYKRTRNFEFGVHADIIEVPKDFILKEKDKLFNSEKGDIVNIYKRNGTEQIWRCVEIKKIE